MAWRVVAERGRPRRVAFLLGTPRCGSWHLLDLLNSLPEVDLGGEALNPRLVNGPSPLVRGPRSALLHLRLAVWSRRGPVVGSKILLPQLAAAGLTPGDLVRGFPDARYVVLYRRSSGDQYVSWLLAQATGRWRSKSGTQPDSLPTVRVDPDAFIRWCESQSTLYRSVLATPGIAERALVVAHEDVRDDPVGVLTTQVCPFLGVEAGPVTTQLEKLNRRSPDEVVENHSEVAGLLAAARLEL